MKRLIPVFLALCLFLTGCGGEKKTTDTIFAMDTVMTFTLYDSGARADAVLSECKGIIYDLEDQLSVTAPESPVAMCNAGVENALDALSNEDRQMVKEALWIAEATDGAYDPTVYALMDLWGFYDDDFSVPTEQELQAALSHTGYEMAEWSQGDLVMPEGMGIDLGGIAKGYAAQQVIRNIAANGREMSAIISLGGNVGIHGVKPDGSNWMVAVEKPDGSGESIALLSIPGAYETYVVTSGAYQRYFEEDGVKYHHILDPETGYPAETDLLSVTIVCENGPWADALSTALFVKGFDGAVDYWQQCLNDTDPFEMVLITQSGIFATPGLNITSEEAVTVLEVTQ